MLVKPKPKLIVCLTGLPGSGKSTVVAVAKSLGFEVVVMGDVVRQEAERRSLELTDENLGTLMVEMRKEKGMEAVGLLAATKIRRSRAHYLVIDGVRSEDEVNLFKRFGKVQPLAVHASPATRYRFLRQRARPDAPPSLRLFRERDKREINIGLSNLENMADEILDNNTDVRSLRVKARALFLRWMK